MSKILSIETSHKTCSVAITSKESVLAIKETEKENSHSSLVTLFVKEVLSQSNTLINDIQAVAVSMGPGSYTGLRIGLSVAKGLCYAQDIPLIGVSTLQAVAYPYYLKNEKTMVAMHARKEEYYVSMYDHQGKCKLEPCVVQLEEINSLLTRAALDQLITDTPNDFNAHSLYPIYYTASNVGLIAHKKLVSNDFSDLAYVEPAYLKPFISSSVK